MVSRALAREVEWGLNQHWSVAWGVGLWESGGSVPMLRARIRPRATVFIRSLRRQVGIIEVDSWWGLTSLVCDCDLCWSSLLMGGNIGPMNASPDVCRGGD